MKRRFEYFGEDKKRGVQDSAKFWEIEIADSEIRIRFGRIGTEGQLKVSAFESSAEAISKAETLVKEKLKKGYNEVSS